MKGNPVFLLGVSTLVLDSHTHASDTSCAAFPHTKQFCDTCLVSYSLTQFSSDPVFLERASARRLRAQPHGTAPTPLPMPVPTSRLSPVPLTKRL